MGYLGFNGTNGTNGTRTNERMSESANQRISESASQLSSLKKSTHQRCWPGIPPPVPSNVDSGLISTVLSLVSHRQERVADIILRGPQVLKSSGYFLYQRARHIDQRSPCHQLHKWIEETDRTAAQLAI